MTGNIHATATIFRIIYEIIELKQRRCLVEFRITILIIKALELFLLYKHKCLTNTFNNICGQKAFHALSFYGNICG